MQFINQGQKSKKKKEEYLCKRLENQILIDLQWKQLMICNSAAQNMSEWF